ncbi:MAG TPA: hypothetical protein VFG50_11450 [Rhodothermales bacterium]|nr:hypothetical protein [Rhodothermales bacterium]
MTSYEISKHLQSFLNATGADRSLTKYLFIVAKGYEKVISELMEVLQAKNRSFFSMKQQSSMEKFAELKRHADTFPLGQIFHDTIELQNLLKTLATAFNANEAHYFREMSRQVDSFYEVFEKLVRAPSREAFTALLPEAHQLYTVLMASRQFISAMRLALEQQGTPLPGRARLALMFETTTAYGAIIRKLSALQTAYDEVCGVAGVSTSEHPLTVIKLEAASLWVCVEGEQTSMQVLTSLIESFALFWYHRFTSEDRMAGCSDRVSATQALVSLADELERVGIMHVSQEAVEIRDAALVLRQVLLELLESEPAIRVNDKLFSVDAALKSRYLEVSGELSREESTAAPARPSLSVVSPSHQDPALAPVGAE